MGLNWGNALSNLGTGLINTGQRAIDEQNRVEGDERRADLALKHAQGVSDIQAQALRDKEARIAEIVKSVPRTDGENDQSYQRRVGERFAEEGQPDVAKSYLDRADKYTDRAELRDLREREFELKERELAQRASERAEALNLKKEDRARLDAAVARYSKAVAFRAQLAPNTLPEDVRRIEGDIAAAGAQLMEFGIRPPTADTGRAAQMKIVKGAPGEGDTIVRDDGRGGVETVDPKALPTHGGRPSESQMQDVRVNGKVIGRAATQAEAQRIVDEYKAQHKK